MRKIEFRGFDYENGVWRYGSLIQYPNGECVIVRFDTDGKELSYDVDPETVGQYTGMRDRHGVGVYEGDVVVYHRYPKDYLTIVFERGTFGVGIRKGSIKASSPLVNYAEVKKNGFILLDVIGNIHDNKDLLK